MHTFIKRDNGFEIGYWPPGENSGFMELLVVDTAIEAIRLVNILNGGEGKLSNSSLPNFRFSE